ncbi:VCBS repeat-containing protein [Agrobacterium pusense]|uniref:BapA/Bap/LapF family large adhesin n=1 Tax=Agrobacterium pusense TaxID=648995 RepID=UPI00285C9729|nr:BapA/Bap/LapF family large adhesin [Agrobacterium pusense]MDR6192763.1 VCBS repeat-containing protein [Agrobacterium pusense]
MNLLPTVTEDVPLGSDTYLAVVSLAGLDLQLFADAIEFGVETGHTQDLNFDFSGLIGADVLGNYSLVVQKWDPATQQWTSIEGGGPATILSLSLFGGTSGTVPGLEPGEYRAFMGFNGLVGVGVGGTLTLEGTDYNFTEIGGYEPVEASGNVLGNDDVPSGTTVQSVDGQTVEPDGTVIQGDFGELLIRPDGSYTYTPFANGAGIGKVDQFEYVVADANGNTGTATLYVQIGSDNVTMTWSDTDPGLPAALEFAATGDSADASVVWTNISDDDFFTASGTTVLSGGLGQTSTYTSGSFVITDNMDVSGSVSVSVLLAALSNGVVYLERETTPGNWQQVASDSFNIIVGGLGTVASIDLAGLDLAAGTYRVRSTLSGTLVNVSATITSDIDVTYTDQYEIGTLTGDSGNLLANDDLGSTFTSFQIFDGTTFVDVTETRTIEGEYGTLTINPDGSYSYTPNSDLAHFTEPQTDMFEYQLTHPGGAVEQSSLVVTVDPSGAGVPDQASMFVADDISGLDGIDVAMSDDPLVSDHDSDADLAGLIEEDGEELTVPLDGLAALDEPDEGDADLSPTEEGIELIEMPEPVELPVDPFGHLVTEDELNPAPSAVI